MLLAQPGLLALGFVAIVRRTGPGFLLPMTEIWLEMWPFFISAFRVKQETNLLNSLGLSTG